MSKLEQYAVTPTRLMPNRLCKSQPERPGWVLVVGLLEYLSQRVIRIESIAPSWPPRSLPSRYYIPADSAK